MNGMVSIIVPIYNCENWLPTCLDSLINQSYSNLEILLVNDGSTDGCLDICEEYAENDRRIRLINKKNGGVSSARNEGLKNVTGDWITFVDADDWLELNAIEKVYNEVQNDYDFCFWDIVCTINKNKSLKPQYLDRATMEDIYETIISGIENSGYHIGSLARGIGAKFFRSDIIKNNSIRFDENLYIGEDAIFILEYLRHIPNVTRIKIADIRGYNYRLLDTSAVHRYKGDLLNQSIRQLTAIQNFLNQEFLDCKKQTPLTVFCWSIFHNLIMNDMHQNNTENHSEKWDDAKSWLQKNSKIMFCRNVEFCKMPRFVKIEWLFSRFFSEEKTCQITAFYLKRRHIEK